MVGLTFYGSMQNNWKATLTKKCRKDVVNGDTYGEPKLVKENSRRSYR